MLGCLEAAIPLAAAPLLTEIYNNTLETLPGEIPVIIILNTSTLSSPGAVYLTRAGFVLVDLLLFLVVALLVKYDQAAAGYSHLDHP